MQNKSKDKFICIFRTAYQSEITIIESLLIDNKIPYYIDNYTFASFGSADGSINFGVMVELARQKEAQELLKEFIKPTTVKEPLFAKKEYETKYKEKHAVLYLILSIFGLLLGIGFLLLTILAIKSRLSIRGAGEVAVTFILIPLFGIPSFFITKSSLKEIVLLTGILRKRRKIGEEKV